MSWQWLRGGCSPSLLRNTRRVSQLQCRPAAPGKSKKLIVIVAIVAVLAIVAAAAYVLMMQRQHNSADGDEGASATVTVPTFLPLDNMVANLSDPGGDRFVQLGITLELADEKTASTVKQYLPSIRNGILMLVSQRTADELLAREGKEKLAADILEEVSAPWALVPMPKACA